MRSKSIKIIYEILEKKVKKAEKEERKIREEDDRRYRELNYDDEQERNKYFEFVEERDRIIGECEDIQSAFQDFESYRFH